MTYNSSKPFVKPVLELIKQTWNSQFLEVWACGDHVAYKLKYSPIKSKKSVHEWQVDHTDGIGTKGYYHYDAKSWENAVLDALAMNLNDLLMYRARPIKLQNHITLPWDDDKDVIAIMEAMVKHCKVRDIVITGGETSINNMTDAMDISITMSGIVNNLASNQFIKGDNLIGLPSSGLHSNGFTKLREVWGDDPHWPDEFIEPTKIYWDDIYPLMTTGKVSGAQNITGGAFTKFNLQNVDIFIEKEIQPQSIFTEIYNKGISDEEMYRTFNCGIGFVLGVIPANTDEVLSSLPTARLIGKVEAGTGRVHILSSFSDKEVVL